MLSRRQRCYTFQVRSLPFAMLLAPVLFVLASLFMQTVGGDAPVPLSVQQAASLLAAGDATGARDAYISVLERDPRNAQAQQGAVQASEKLALAARARGDSDGALKILLAAQTYAPENPKLLFDLGVLEDSMKLYWDADAVVAKLEATPAGSSPGVLYLVARVKLDLGQLAPAAQKMQAYLALRPDDATAHYGMGRILQLQEQFDAARAEFERSLALQPRQTESNFQLGEIALAQNRFEDAIAAYAHTLAADPAHGGALAGTGIAYFRLKQYTSAEENLQKATAAAPDYEPAHYYLGLTLARLGQKAASQTELAKATALEAAQSAASAQRIRLHPEPAPGQTPQAAPQ